MTELRTQLAPWTAQLPPGADDSNYLARCQRFEAGGWHPTLAAVLAEKYPTWYQTREVA